MNRPEIICDRPSPRRRDRFQNRIIDYSKEELFKDWPQNELLACLKVCLKSPPINLELATLIWKELQNQGEDHALAKEKIIKSGGEIISWLPGARYRVSSLIKNFKYETTRPTSYKVYFILLYEYNKKPPKWGLYIGQTQKKIETRFAIHLDPDNPHRSRKVTPRGRQLLYSLCSLVPPMRKADSLKFEQLLLKSLRGEGREKTLRQLSKNIVRGG